jgi:mannosyltransferase OCH1-like enzyme
MDILDQGATSAPELVQSCWESWRRHNPETRLEVVDRQSISKYSDLPDTIDLSRPDLTVQKIANLVRLDLLSRHGGVWVDATVYCSGPLKDWLPHYMKMGFFAFRNPGPDRLLSNWFLAADPYNELIHEFAARYIRALQRSSLHSSEHPLRRHCSEAIEAMLSKRVRTSRYWVERPWTQLLRTYPYFQAHYTFNSIILSNTELAEIWQSVPDYPASGPHFLARCAKQDGGTQQALDFIQAKGCSVHKLNWRVNIEDAYWRVILRALSQT